MTIIMLLIVRESEDKFLRVEVDMEKKTIWLVSKYSDTPIAIGGDIDVGEVSIDAGVAWGYPFDYLTHRIMQQIIDNAIIIPTLEDVSMEEIFNELYPVTVIKDREIQYSIRFAFNKKYLQRGEQLADFFLQFLQGFITAIANFLP